MGLEAKFPNIQTYIPLSDGEQKNTFLEGS